MSLPKESAAVTLDKQETNQVTEIAGKLYKAIPGMSSDYQHMIKHTGGILSTSMSHAYARGLQDALKFLLKQNPKGEENNEQK